MWSMIWSHSPVPVSGFRRPGLVLGGLGGPHDRSRGAHQHYGLATLDQIKALPVAALAADDCVLFLWGTWPKLPQALEVISAWGFQYKTDAFVWIKENGGGGLHTGMGYYTRSNSEFCLLATKGSPTRLAKDVHQVVMAPVGKHSAKPEEVRRRIERLFVGPYLELYGRESVSGWTVWGNEIPRSNFVICAKFRRGGHRRQHDLKAIETDCRCHHKIVIGCFLFVNNLVAVRIPAKTRLPRKQFNFATIGIHGIDNVVELVRFLGMCGAFDGLHRMISLPVSGLQEPRVQISNFSWRTEL